MPTSHGPIGHLGAWTVPSPDADRRPGGNRLPRSVWTSWSSVAIAVGIAASSSYALLAADPYRDLPEATLIAAKAQDACSVLVAVLLLLLRRRPSARVHLVRLGLLAYVAYSYSIYLIGVPMNRVFLVYVVLVTVSGAALLDGVVRLRPDGWPRVSRPRLERGTGWVLVAVAVLFAALWLTALLPFASGGAEPDAVGPGGAAYPVFVLDLVVALPCVAAVGVLALRGRAIAGPLVVVVLVKIITLFTALWAGVIVGLAMGAEVHLAADAGPSVVMLGACAVLLRRWLRALSPDESAYARSTIWGS
jgi:hypothetical protein